MVDWQPIATFASALVVLTAAGITVRQRDRADRKTQWWIRTQWALELALSEDPRRRRLGVDVLDEQARSRTADTEDLSLMSSSSVPELRGARPVLDRPLRDEEDDCHEVVEEVAAEEDG